MNALPEFIEVPEAYTGCVTRLPNELILHCFRPYGTRLRGFHKIELDKLARQIGTRDRMRKRVEAIWIYGHSAKFKDTPKSRYAKNAGKRATAVRACLERALRRERLSYRPHIGHTSLADMVPLVPNMEKSVSKQARRNRSINRRVEINIVWA